MRKFSARRTPLLLAFFTSLMMSFLMSMVITFINLGPAPDFLLRWMNAWLMAFAIAFPIIQLVLPISRRIVAAITLPEG